MRAAGNPASPLTLFVVGLTGQETATTRQQHWVRTATVLAHNSHGTGSCNCTSSSNLPLENAVALQASRASQDPDGTSRSGVIVTLSELAERARGEHSSCHLHLTPQRRNRRDRHPRGGQQGGTELPPAPSRSSPGDTRWAGGRLCPAEPKGNANSRGNPAGKELASSAQSSRHNTKPTPCPC